MFLKYDWAPKLLYYCTNGGVAWPGLTRSAFPRYFEDLIATAVAADAEANAPLEEVLTEEERDEVAKLRGAVDELSDKYEGILDSLRTDEVCVRGRTFFYFFIFFCCVIGCVYVASLLLQYI